MAIAPEPNVAVGGPPRRDGAGVSEKASWGLQPGDEIVPGLRAQKVLGGGHRYEAFLALDEELHYLVVAKVLRPDQTDDEDARRTLRREASILEAVAHPVIARVFGHDAEGPRPHLRLEFVEGPCLSTLVRRFGSLVIDQAVPLAVELGSALHSMHRRGFVHLDVKPTNTIMGSPPRLIDLSVARSIERAAKLEHPVGTDAYMAPEQARPHGGAPVGPPADVWGLAVTTYEAVTGHLPFPDEDGFPQLDRRPEPLPREVPAALVHALGAALAFDPADRPTPVEFAGELAPLLDRPPRVVLSRLKPR
jgi:serine/threonine protein kinase